MDVFGSQNYPKLFKISGIYYFNKNTLALLTTKILKNQMVIFGVMAFAIMYRYICCLT